MSVGEVLSSCRLLHGVALGVGLCEDQGPDRERCLACLTHFLGYRTQLHVEEHLQSTKVFAWDIGGVGEGALGLRACHAAGSSRSVGVNSAGQFRLPQGLNGSHQEPPIWGRGVGQVGMLEGCGVAKFGGDRESEQVADSVDVPAEGVDLTKKAVLPQIPWRSSIPSRRTRAD